MKILKQTSLKPSATIVVPASKSMSNRALIINALCKNKSRIKNLSTARDTLTLQQLLRSENSILDVLDAGTTMRFLTSYLAATNQHKTLTGTARMQQRPIGLLVDALREIGANINYVKKEGYPPIQINGLEKTKNSVNIRGDVSSQYISALLMIAPIINDGLKITLEGKIGSKPYIDMTLSLMRHYGVTSNWSGNTIEISPQEYIAKDITIEPDWSSASYWYSMVALSTTGNIKLSDFTEHSLQGDQKIAEIMAPLGVSTEYQNDGIKLSKTDHKHSFSYDFCDCPDLAQTVAVVCAAKGIKCTMTGLESLKIKETDRVIALQKELSKIGAQLVESNNQWNLIPANQLPSKISVKTYEDHRMAMAFAPLCMLMDITIENESVVNKSYPSFWEDLSKVCG